MTTIKNDPNISPKPCSNFIGREAELKELSDTIKSAGSVLIKGSKGVGKNELVNKFILDNEKSYDEIFRISNFDASFNSHWAYLLESYPQVPIPEFSITLFQFLKYIKNWLIVFSDMDNVNDRDFIKEQLSLISADVNASENRHIIFIEEHKIMPTCTKTITLSNLSEENSVSLIKAIGKEYFKDNFDEATTLNLAKLSQGHPLLIETLVNFITANKIKDLQTELIDKLENKSDHKEVFTSVMKLFHTQLKETTTFPYDMFSILLCFGGDTQIKEEWLEMMNTISIKIPSIRELTSTLKKFGLCKTTAGSSFTIHREYILTLRTFEDKAQHDNAITTFFYNSLMISEKLPQLEITAVYTHIIKLIFSELDMSVHIGHFTLTIISVAEFFANFYQNLDESLYFSEMAVDLLSDAPDEEFANGLKFRIYKHLGIIYSIKPPVDNEKSYKYTKDAYKLFKVLKKKIPPGSESKLFEDEEPFMILSIGLGLVNRKKYKKGIDLFEQVLELCRDKPERILEYTKALNNLGYTYCLAKDYKKSIYYYRQSINATPKNAHDINALTTYRNLALTYIYTGDTKKANENIEHVYKIISKAPGSNKLLEHIKEEYKKDVQKILDEMKMNNRQLTTTTVKYVTITAAMACVGIIALKYFSRK